MAFTDAQKTKIRFYLGYPNILKSANTRLENALDLLGEEEGSQAEVEAILADIVLVEEKLRSTALDVAGISDVGPPDPKFYKAQIYADLRGEGRRLSARLSILAGVGIAGDVWGEYGYNGDWWSSYDNQVGLPFLR